MQSIVLYFKKKYMKEFKRIRRKEKKDYKPGGKFFLLFSWFSVVNTFKNTY